MTQTLEAPPPASTAQSVRGDKIAERMLWIIAILSIIPFYWTMQAAYERLVQRNPQSPWETEILLDGYRAAHGLPVYTLPDQDHATHMYGPAITYALGAVFRVTGFRMSGARWFSLLSGLMLTIGIVWAFARKHGLAMTFIAATLLLIGFYRARGYLTEGRPDVTSIFFEAIALWMFYLGHTRHGKFIAIGCAAMVAGFLFKQTTFAIAFVPGFVFLITWPKPIARHFLFAVIPVVVVAASLMVLRFGFPVVNYYMTGARLFPFNLSLWPFRALSMVSYDTLFMLMLALWFFGVVKPALSRSATIWLLSAILVTGISGSEAVARDGGQVNSYLPPFLAMATFTIVMLPDALRKVKEVCASQWMAMMVAVFIGVVILADATSVPRYEYWSAATKAYGDKHYPKIVARVRELKGKVISPDDPTIAFLAKGYLGRSIISQFDALGRRSRPTYLLGEMKHADYLVRVNGDWTTQVPLTELRAAGYQQVKDHVFKKTHYELWRREPAAAKEASAPKKGA